MNFEWMYVLDASTKARSNEDQALEPLCVSPDQQSRWNHKADPVCRGDFGLVFLFPLLFLVSSFWGHPLMLRFQ